MEGKMEEKRQIALEMLKEDLSVELVSKITKLSRDEIEELKKKL
jgi:predicted transposase YdaD